MDILVDTNILLRWANPADPQHPVTAQAVRSLLIDGHDVLIVPQNFYEFWAVATRPLTANGLGLGAPECQSELARLRTVFHVLDDRPTLLAEWEALVVAYGCHGRVSFDARLAAAMRTHGVTHLLTFNGTDFQRYPWLTVLDPLNIGAAGSAGTP